MTKKSDESHIKILLKSGQAITAYATQDSLFELETCIHFTKLRDDSNDIYLCMDAVAAWENMDKRQDGGPSSAEEITAGQQTAQV